VRHGAIEISSPASRADAMWAQIEDECGIARARAWLGMKPIGGLVRYGEPSGDHAAADSADVRGHRRRLTATQAPTKGAKAADLIAEDYGLFFGFRRSRRAL
jgi:hypothetical protein